MRALQELIPHSHKMAELKVCTMTLRIYVVFQHMFYQFMWMESQMAQMVLPGIQNYMYWIGMGISPAATIPQMQNLMRFSRLTQIYQAMAVASMPNQTAVGLRPVLNPVSYQNQMQSPRFQEKYANYSSVYLMQNTFQLLGAQLNGFSPILDAGNIESFSSFKMTTERKNVAWTTGFCFPVTSGGEDTLRQVEVKYPALLFKQQLTTYVEKIYGLIRDNSKEISPILGLCIQAPINSRASLVKGSSCLVANTVLQSISI